MAKINVDLLAIRIRKILNHNDRNSLGIAKTLVIEALAKGIAKPDTQKLAAELFAKGKGRHATGPRYWMEIGHENYWMQVETNMSQGDRLAKLAFEFDVSEKHAQNCITMYNSGLKDGRE